MNASLISFLAAAMSPPLAASAELMSDLSVGLALVTALAIAAWTLAQYGHPRRFIELPREVITPDFDDRGDARGTRRAWREAA